MRLFVAIDLDDEAREAAAEAAAALARRVAKGSLRDRIRWVPPENFHLTLQFLGWLPAERQPDVHQALATQFLTRPFHLELTGAGTFPPAGRPRVIWLGLREGHGRSEKVTEPAARLARLQAEIGERLARRGFEPESRPFSPHLTIGRVREASRDPADLRRLVEETSVRAARWPVTHVTLYQSQVSPHGARYTPLLRTPLVPRRHEGHEGHEAWNGHEDHEGREGHKRREDHGGRED